MSEKTLDMLYESGQVIALEEGDTVIRHGDRIGNIFCILSGEVDILVPDDLSGHGGLTWINMLVEGECIGEYTFLDHQPASATVKAKTPTQVFKLPHETLHRLIDDDVELRAQVYKNLLECLVQRLRNTNMYIDYLQRDKPKRSVMI